MSSWNLVLSWVEHEKSFITSEPEPNAISMEADEDPNRYLDLYPCWISQYGRLL